MTIQEILEAHIPTTALGQSNQGAGGGSNFRYCKCGKTLEVAYAELPADSFDLNELLDRKIAEHIAKELSNGR